MDPLLEILEQIPSHFQELLSKAIDVGPAKTLLKGMEQFFLMDYPHSHIIIAACMALQSAIAVHGINDKKVKSGEKKLKHFHGLVMTVLVSYGGGLFLPPLLGNPAGFFLNADTNVLVGTIVYFIVNCLPFGLHEVFFHVFSRPIPTTIITANAQIMRAKGLVGVLGNIKKFSYIANPTYLYPNAIVGPILVATMAGNVGPIYRHGWTAHFSKGMPWNFENGLVCASWYHFYVNDFADNGPIGLWLHDTIHSVPAIDGFIKSFESEAIFARTVIFVFMVFVGVMQTKHFFGPSYNPFTFIHKIFYVIFGLTEDEEEVAVKVEPASKFVPMPPKQPKPSTPNPHVKGNNNGNASRSESPSPVVSTAAGKKKKGKKNGDSGDQTNNINIQHNKKNN